MIKQKSWNPKGCVIEWLEKGEWRQVMTARFSLNNAVERIAHFRKMLPEVAFRIRVP